MKPLDMKDIAIIGAFPVYNCEKTVLNVGCGRARIDFHLAIMGYQVYATDIETYETWQETTNLSFHESSILDLESFPIQKASVVIASEVLEHLKDYKTALANLLKLSNARLIMTIPSRHSFHHPSHCNFWDDQAIADFKDIKEFIELCKPYRTTISKIITKPQDAGKQFAYLIVVDKRQKLRINKR